MMARSYKKTGLPAMKRKVTIHGLAVIDRRSKTFRRAMQWRQEVEADLGDTITAQKSTILATTTLAVIQFEQLFGRIVKEIEHVGEQAIINTRRRSVYPYVVQATQLGESINRAMVQLGLERKAPQGPKLDEYLKARYGKKPRKPRTRKPRIVATTAAPAEAEPPPPTMPPEAPAAADSERPGAAIPAEVMP